LVSILCAVIQIPVLSMFHTGQNLAQGRAIAFQFIRDDHPRLPHTQVLLWVSGEQLQAAFEHVVLAEYRCHYDWRDRKVTDIREGVFYPTRFASPQGRLILLTPQECMVVYRARPSRRRVPRCSPVQQLLLFDVVPTG
jgi:hypothetical protein